MRVGGLGEEPMSVTARPDSRAPAVEKMSRFGGAPPAAFVSLVAMAMVGIVIWAPLAGATTPTPIVLTAPYAHGSMYNLNPTVNSATGCGERATDGIAPKWSATTGLAKFSLKDTSSSCTGTGANGTFAGVAQSSPSFRALLPLTLTGNETSVKATWTVTISGAQTLSSSGTCPRPVLNATGGGFDDCYAGAGWLVSLQAQLADKTTGFGIHDRVTALTEKFNESMVRSNVSCTSSVCTTTNSSAGGTAGGWTGTFGVTFYLNGTFYTGNTYVLWLTIDGAAYAFYDDSYSSLGVTGAFPVVHSWAHLDMARSGDQADLDSVEIS
jgi:hypothetical protein